MNFYCLEELGNAAHDLLRLTFAVLLGQPLQSILLVLLVVASGVAIHYAFGRMAQGNHVGWNCSRIVRSRIGQRYPMVSAEGVPEVRNTPADCTSSIEVFNGEIPILNSKDGRKISTARPSGNSCFTHLVRIGKLPTSDRSTSLGFMGYPVPNNGLMAFLWMSIAPNLRILSDFFRVRLLPRLLNNTGFFSVPVPISVHLPLRRHALATGALKSGSAIFVRLEKFDSFRVLSTALAAGSNVINGGIVDHLKFSMLSLLTRVGKAARLAFRAGNYAVLSQTHYTAPPCAVQALRAAPAQGACA